MKKCGLLTLVLVFLLLPLSKPTEAKLTIIPPQQMIEQSSIIVIGTVTKKEYSEQQRQVGISVETVVKGKIQQKEIELKRDQPPMYGWLGFDFPETGTKIMILLQQNDQLTLTGDANAVAILDDNDVKLYRGSTMGQFTPETYEDAYKAYLHEHAVTTMPVMTSYKMIDNGGTIMPAVEAKQQTATTLLYASMIVGCVVAALFLFFRIMKR